MTINLFINIVAHSITRFDLDGSNPTVLYNNSAVTIHGITLDYFEYNVYWIETDATRRKKICYTSLNGGKIETFKILESPSSYEFSGFIDVDQHYVYYVTKSSKNDNFYHLIRAEKVDGFLDADFDITESHEPYQYAEFESISVLSGNPQKVHENHPCQPKNGGCKGFCVAVPDKNKKLNKKCINTTTSYIKKICSWIRICPSFIRL